METKNYFAAAHAMRVKIGGDLQDLGRYDTAINEALEHIAEAEPGPARSAAAASFGGVLRRIRGKVRVEITLEIMALLEITATVHVARAVMKKVFKQSVSGDLLVERFADPGRNASNKVMPDARNKLDKPEGELAAKLFSEVYEWFSETALPTHVYDLKRKHAKSKMKADPA